MDLSNFGSQMGRALAGIVSGDNYRNAYDASMAKLAQADAMGASATLNRTKADAITNRMQYQRPEFSSKIAAGFAGLNDNQLGQVEAYQRGEIPTPEFFTPDVQRAYNYGVGVHRAGLGGTGDSNADQMGKLFEALTRTGNVQRVIADPTTAAAVGKAYAATEGKPLVGNLGNAGTFDQFDMSAPQNLNGIGTATIDREKTAAIENRAQAANAYASAALSKEKINTEKADADLKRSKIGQASEQTITLPDGTVIQSAPKLTEGQGKAQLFGARAAEADKIITGLEGKYSPLAINAKTAAEDMWGIGGVLGAVGNKMLPEEAQKVEQAQRDFLNAILRQESGAVISPSEFDNAKKQYFPQPGDKPEVIEQKRRNRENAIAGFRTMAGPAASRVRPMDQDKKTPAQDNTAILREARAAISAGAPRAAVIERLKAMGINEGGL